MTIFIRHPSNMFPHLIHHPLDVFPQLLNMFHFMELKVTPQIEGHTTVLAHHYIIIFQFSICPLVKHTSQTSLPHMIQIVIWGVAKTSIKPTP